MTSKAYYTARQVAERLGVSVPTVWRWARYRTDFPKPIRIGPAATRWRFSDLEIWEQKQGEMS